MVARAEPKKKRRKRMSCAERIREQIETWLLFQHQSQAALWATIAHADLTKVKGRE